MIQIDKGIPMPPVTHGPAPVYPWRDMLVGDSFYIERPAAKDITANFCGWKARHGRRSWRISVRIDGAGFRVWRVA